MAGNALVNHNLQRRLEKALATGAAVGAIGEAPLSTIYIVELGVAIEKAERVLKYSTTVGKLVGGAAAASSGGLGALAGIRGLGGIRSRVDTDIPTAEDLDIDLGGQSLGVITSLHLGSYTKKLLGAAQLIMRLRESWKEEDWTGVEEACKEINAEGEDGISGLPCIWKEVERAEDEVNNIQLLADLKEALEAVCIGKKDGGSTAEQEQQSVENLRKAVSAGRRARRSSSQLSRLLQSADMVQLAVSAATSSTAKMGSSEIKSPFEVEDFEEKVKHLEDEIEIGDTTERRSAGVEKLLKTAKIVRKLRNARSEKDWDAVEALLEEAVDVSDMAREEVEVSKSELFQARATTHFLRALKTGAARGLTGKIDTSTIDVGILAQVIEATAPINRTKGKDGGAGHGGKADGEERDIEDLSVVNQNLREICTKVRDLRLCMLRGVGGAENYDNAGKEAEERADKWAKKLSEAAQDFFVNRKCDDRRKWIPALRLLESLDAACAIRVKDEILLAFREGTDRYFAHYFDQGVSNGRAVLSTTVPGRLDVSNVEVERLQKIVAEFRRGVARDLVSPRTLGLANLAGTVSRLRLMLMVERPDWKLIQKVVAMYRSKETAEREEARRMEEKEDTVEEKEEKTKVSTRSRTSRVDALGAAEINAFEHECGHQLIVDNLEGAFDVSWYERGRETMNMKEKVLGDEADRGLLFNKIAQSRSFTPN